ncbi:HAD-IIB family hydrolase [Bradyrhizobium sp. B097]|uniref:HAD-IIB family hydrolase n=1 Tax=Bradyrhizobium sp. B097 TaxID=3140244 RepID=UPI0031830631
MQPISKAHRSEFCNVRFVLTDMDETLTYQGRLAARTFEALERLQQAGLTVIPVTAAPAGWCDQMARMWPVDGVIGENGGFFFRRHDNGDCVERHFWHPAEHRQRVAGRLAAISAEVSATHPAASLAEDQPFRLTSVAFSQPNGQGDRDAITAALRRAGADVTVNNLWILGWLGGYDKLAMTHRVMTEAYGVDLDRQKDEILYIGDSTNDAPMFGYFRHTVGVSSIVRYLADIRTPPAWITEGPGGAGFVEMANALIASRGSARSARGTPIPPST